MTEIPTYEELLEKNNELKQSLEFYRTLVDNSQDLFYRTDLEGRISYISPSVYRLSGYTVDEAVGMNMAEEVYVCPEERSDFLATLKDEGQVTGFEARLKRKDGSVWWASTNAHLYKDSEGNVLGVEGITREITRLKQLEDKLYASERTFRSTLDAVPFPVAVVDLQDDKIFFWSQSAKKIFGHTAPTASEWYQIAYPDPHYREQVLERWKPFLDKARKSGLPVNTGEYRVTCRDGSVRICELFATFLPDHLIVTFNDITERKQIENAQRKSEELFRNLINSAPEGIFVQAKGYFVFLNPAMVKIFGATNAEEIIDTDLMSRMAPEYHEAIRDRIRFQSETGKPVPLMDQVYLRVDGSRIPVETTAVSVQYQGSNAHLVFVRDISARNKAEESLRESETRYRSVLETIKEGVILQSASGEILTWNTGAEALFGISAEDVIGRTSEDRDWSTIREDGSKYEGKDHPSMRTLQTGKPCRNEIMGVYQPSGEVRWISVNTNPLFRADEAKPYAVVISFSDVTEIKREKDQSQMYLDATTDGIWTWNFQTNTFFFSPKYYKMLGYAPDAFPADYDHWVNLIHPDDRKKALATATEYLRKKQDTYESEFRLRTADGNYRWIHSRAKVVKRDSNGEAVLMVGNHEDITERKQAELALRESEEKFRNFTEQSFVGFYIIQDDVLKYVNPKFADIFGYTADECMKGIPFRQLVHTEDLAMVQEQVRRRVAGEVKAVQYTFRGVKKNGEIIHVSIYGSSLIYLGRPAAIGTMLDITNEMEMEKRMAYTQRMEAIGSLAGGIAHDFNNILFPIVGLSEMLIEDLSPESPQHESAVEIYSAGKRGSDLVKQILAFSRQSEQKKMPVRIQQILKEVMKLTRSTIPANIPIEEDIQSDCGMVFADATQIHQILMNLITNAYHAVEETNGKITVQLKETEIKDEWGANTDLIPGRYAMITVSDTGSGIDPALTGKIFEPYFTTKEQGKGTGLGLAVVHGIVKDHKGEIKLHSKIGEGSIFNVYLPIIEKAAKSLSVEEKRDHPKGNERILLVDDEESIVYLEKQMLQRLGYQVTTRVNSVEALAAFKENPDAFDLVISDMTMPNMTGDQLAGELIAIRPDIPVIICTGFSERLNQERAAGIGVRGFLMKPIVLADLSKTVRQVLDENKS